jgi:DNA-binding NarL/FixJ family response regulator
VITVLVVARHAAARARLEALVAGSRAVRLIAAPPGMPLGEQARTARPDVVLVDLDGERIDTALHDLRSARAGVIVLDDNPRWVLVDEPSVRSLLRGVLPRDVGAGEILAAVQAVAAGLVALHPEALDTLRRRGPARATSDPAQPLTAREIEVLAMLAEGLGNKAIASRLAISSHTAKFHVAAIMGKLGAGSRTEAVALGMRRGLVAI